MSAQDVKWIVIASVLLVSFSLWVGAHFPAPNQSSARMASLLDSASSRSLTGSSGAVVPAVGDSWHSPTELARLKAEVYRLDKEEQDMAKPIPYDASRGFDAQHLDANAPQIGRIDPSSPVDTRSSFPASASAGGWGDSANLDPNGIGYDFNSQVRDAGTGDGSPSDGDTSSSDQSVSDRYFNPYDPAHYYPPGYTPSGYGSSSGGSDNDTSINDNLSSDNQEDFNQNGNQGDFNQGDYGESQEGGSGYPQGGGSNAPDNGSSNEDGSSGYDTSSGSSSGS